MRPRYLEIEGLQSFKELQKIDFDALSDGGIFGIFGPTGSGKSTILDAITLALYGNVQRANRGTQGIMNTDCNSLRVAFTFDLTKGSKRKTYRVERLYKRKKEGETAVEAKTARLFEISGGGELVLAEKTGEVTEKVTELIGLRLEDFTRSVVLPQNKFQEFLNLPNAERRQMLERIFYLEEYGRQLTERINRKLAFVNSKLDYIGGYILGLANASEQALKEAEEKMKNAAEHKEKIDAELKATEEKYSEASEIWRLVNELEDLAKEEQLHLLKAEEIKIKKDKCEKAIKAEGVKELIFKHKELTLNIEEAVKSLKEKEILLPELECKLKSTKEALDKKSIEISEEIPKLLRKKHDFEQAKALKEDLSKLGEAIDSMLKDFYASQKKLEKVNAELKTLKENLESEEARGKALKDSIDKLKVSPEYRIKVQEAVKLITEVRKLKENKEEQENKLSEVTEELQRNNKLLTKIQDNAGIIKSRLNSLKEALKEHGAKKPEGSLEIAKRESEIYKFETLFQTQKTEYEVIEDLKDKLLAAEENLNLSTLDLKKYEGKKSVISGVIAQIQKEIQSLDEKYRKNTAYVLALELKEGSPCPVCGASHHPNPATYQEGDLNAISKQLEELRTDLLEKDKTYKELELEIIKRSEKLNTIKGQILDYKSLIEQKELKYKEIISLMPEEIRNKTPEEIGLFIEDMKNAISISRQKFADWEAEGEKLKESIEKESELLSSAKLEEEKLKTLIEALEKNVYELSQVIAKLSETIQLKYTMYDSELYKLGIEDAIAEELNIRNKDKAYEATQRHWEENQRQVNSIRVKIEELAELKQELTAKQAQIKNEGENLRKQQKEKQCKMQQLTEGRDIEIVLSEIDEMQLRLKREQDELNISYNSLLNSYNGFLIEVNNLKGKVEIFAKDMKLLQVRLENSLKEKGFENIYEAEEALLEPDLRLNLQKEIDAYMEIQKKLEGQKDMIKRKLAGRKITREQWENVSAEYDEKKYAREESIGIYESAKNTYDAIKKDHKIWIELNNEKKGYEKKKDLLEHIQKLLKGNSFIEFISEERLRYVAREASETLGVLTRYRYALELDSESGFVVRDNRNGGVHRHVSTLSGGETFLTSLSLALALSKQIQLKGQSPLEFFFLDEGFGTLDNTLLDTVMDSLERISSKERVIGLISHVPELKIRTGRRLIVEPPTHDGRGSVVRIEKA